jgi:hypothetical protein|tara:strand:- start:404 stop:802 length:399 start_codon:yes stop_codon:yes gene_type:complete
MANYNDLLGGGGIVCIDENHGAVSAPSNRYFIAVQNTAAAGTFTVKGVGLFEYVDIDAASADDVVKYINPDTGLAFADEAEANGVAAGYFEVITGEKTVTLEIGAGQTVYGKFTEVDATDTNAALLYIGGHR